MKHLGIETARRALARWAGVPESLEHVQTSGNDVYRFRLEGAPWILRLTDRAYRTPEHNVAEMEFLEYLERHGARVAAPRPSKAQALVEVLDDCSASVLAWAQGTLVTAESPHWNEAMFREWGRALGTIHAAARTYDGRARWAWWEEDLIAQADTLLPPDDVGARAEFVRVMAEIHALPRSRDTYGLTHADFGPQNFNYEPGSGVTSFDFGNCCFHWYAMDVAISLSTLRRHADRDRYRAWLLAGYRERSPLDEALWSRFPLFLRLRLLYVFLSRLQSFGNEPNLEQRATLDQLRALVVNGVDWK